jgi:HD superfamily phosphodiesterase
MSLYRIIYNQILVPAPYQTFLEPTQTDPFWESERQLMNTEWTLDHVRSKLMVLKNSMHTKTAKKIAERRTEFMGQFVNQLRSEILFYT